MSRASQEMLHCLHSPENLIGNNLDMSLLQRQRARLKWQQQQQQQEQEQELQQQQSEQPQQSFFNETQFNVFSLPDPITETQQFQALLNNDLALRELVNRSMKADPGLENGWLDLGRCPIPRTEFVGEEPGFVSSGFATNPAEMNYPLSRTSSSPPEMAVEKGRESEKMGSAIGRESFKKRKSDKAQSTKVISAEDTRDKRMKGDVDEVESKVTEENNNNNNNTEASADTSKENSKVSEVQKQDYIHVRARRGQATDSHSLAERVRREKISERMKYLQDLVPGCNKITGKAGMLDEIINYVQSLQRQVEFLSMKLAAVNPRLDFNIDNFFGKEVFPACTGDFPTVGMSSEMGNPTFLQFNPVQQVVSGCGLDMGINPSDITLRRSSTSAPVSAPETFLDSSCFTQAQAQPSSCNWDNDLQSLYNVEFQQGRSNLFPFQPFTGTMEANNLKMEM